jgi:hypothetical protein
MATDDAPKKRPQIQMEKAQAMRDAYDKRSSDVAEARQKALEIDAVKTARLRAHRLAKKAANEAAAPPPPQPARR